MTDIKSIDPARPKTVRLLTGGMIHLAVAAWFSKGQCVPPTRKCLDNLDHEQGIAQYRATSVSEVLNGRDACDEA